MKQVPINISLHPSHILLLSLKFFKFRKLFLSKIKRENMYMEEHFMVKELGINISSSRQTIDFCSLTSTNRFQFQFIFLFLQFKDRRIKIFLKVLNGKYRLKYYRTMLFFKQYFLIHPILGVGFRIQEVCLRRICILCIFSFSYCKKQ